MKYLFLILIGITAFQVNAQKEGTRIGYIDYDLAFSKMPAYQDARIKVQNTADSILNVLKKNEEKYDDLYEDWKESVRVYGGEHSHTKDIRSKLDNLKEDNKRLTDRADYYVERRSEKLMNQLNIKLQLIVEQVRIEKGFDMIIIGAGTVVAADQSLNITDDVIQKF